MTNELKIEVEKINNRLSELKFGSNPAELYEPIRYIMSLGGKRMRPLLVLLAYRLFKRDADVIIDQAISVEVFHNFTLMHDDIMDNAPLRRGKETVHEKWNPNVAILSGDVMLVKAYEYLTQSPSGDIREILSAFNNCALGVCEGQQFDMNFESNPAVEEDEYLEMIKMKTAILLGYSLQLGAMLAESSTEQAKLLYDFGCDIGIGFQLMDDLLDVYADQDKFGKQVGGDIIANKKTFLMIKALELANEEQRMQLNHWIGAISFNNNDKVEAVTEIFNQIGIKQLTETKMNAYFEQGFKSLDKLSVPAEGKKPLTNLVHWLINRDQ
jgi:geranylgeranyl diphosphate synthase, type II